MTEIWYSDSMPPNSYRVCSGIPYGEDRNCADQIKVPWLPDHKAYYGVPVGTFC